MGEICEQQVSTSVLLAHQEVASTYDQIADQDLQNLRLQARPILENPLQETNKYVPKRRTDKSAIYGHLWYPRADIVPMLAAIVCYP